MSWITLVLFSSIISAMIGTLDKYLLKSSEPATPAFVTAFGLVGLPIAVVGVLTSAALPWPQLIIACLAGLIFLVAAWRYHVTLALQEVENTQVQSLLQLTSVQKLFLAAFFLGESLSTTQLVAFWVIIASTVVLVLKPASRKIQINRYALRIIPVTSLLALDGTMMAYVYRTSSVWQGETWYSVGLVVGTLILGGYSSYRKQYFWQTTRRRMWGFLLFGQALRTVNGFIPAWAIAHGVPIALLGAFSGSRFIWVWLLAVIILREPINRQTFFLKGSGIIGMAAGVAGLTLWS